MVWPKKKRKKFVRALQQYLIRPMRKLPYAPGLINTFRVQHSSESWTDVYIFDGDARRAVRTLRAWGIPIYGKDVRSDYSPTGQAFYDRIKLRIFPERVIAIQRGGLDV